MMRKDYSRQVVKVFFCNFVFNQFNNETYCIPVLVKPFSKQSTSSAERLMFTRNPIFRLFYCLRRKIVYSQFVHSVLMMGKSSVSCKNSCKPSKGHHTPSCFWSFVCSRDIHLDNNFLMFKYWCKIFYTRSLEITQHQQSHAS